MAGEDKVARVLLQYEIQKQKLTELKAANADVLKDLDAIGTGATQAGDKARFLSEEFVNFRERAEAARRESVDLRAGILGLDTSLKDASDGSIDLAGNLQKVRDEIQAAKDAADDAGPSLDSLTGDEGGSSGGGSGRIGLKRGGEVLSRLGLGEAGRGLSTVGDLADIGKFKEEFSQLSPSILATGAATVGLTVALDLYTKAQEEAKKAALAEIDARQKAIALAVTGTQEEIQAQLNKLQKQREINKIIAGDANGLYASLQLELAKQQGNAALNLEVLAAESGHAAGAFQAAHDAAKVANDALNSTSTEMDILTQATGKTAQSAEQAAVAEKLLADQRKQLSIISENASDIGQIIDLEANGKDVQAVQDLADAKRRDIEVSQFAEQATRDYANTLDKNSEVYKEAIAQAEKYHDAQERDRNFIDRLSQSTYELVGARQKEAETIDSVKKYNADNLKATDDYLAKVTDINQKAADKAIDLAQKKADAEEAALEKLTSRLADLNLSLQRAGEDSAIKAARDAADAQVKIQREVAKDARDHANNLLKIQQEANAKAEDAIAKRDFSGLYQIRRDQRNAVTAEQERYSQQQEDRLTAIEQERDDKLLGYQRDAEDRNRKYQRDIQDANTQYTKEHNAALSNYNKQLNLQAAASQRELTDLQNKYNAAALLRQQAEANELKLIQNGNVARALLQQAANNTLLAQAQQLIAGLGGNPGAVSVPAGIGSVNNSRNIGSSTYNITGPNPQAIGRVVKKIVNQQIAYMTG